MTKKKKELPFWTAFGCKWVGSLRCLPVAWHLWRHAPFLIAPECGKHPARPRCLVLRGCRRCVCATRLHCLYSLTLREPGWPHFLHVSRILGVASGSARGSAREVGFAAASGCLGLWWRSLSPRTMVGAGRVAVRVVVRVVRVAHEPAPLAAELAGTQPFLPRLHRVTHGAASGHAVKANAAFPER